MDEETTERVIRAVESWARRHPSPDAEAIHLFGRGGLSPRQIIEALRHRTEIGELLLEMLDGVIQESSLEEVLQGFDSGRSITSAAGHGD